MMDKGKMTLVRSFGGRRIYLHAKVIYTSKLVQDIALILKLSLSKIRYVSKVSSAKQDRHLFL